MKTYKHWQKAQQDVEVSKHITYDVIAWAGSNISDADALAKAQELLQKRAERLQSGDDLDWYEYATGTLREELIETITDANGNAAAAITRNRYGSLVLNTSSLFMADIDIRPANVFDKLFAMFGKAVKDEAWHIEHIKHLQAQNPSLAMIIYRTKAGLRALVINEPFDPTSSKASKLLEQLHSDELYMTLCRNQQCFRARLSPKPWRCRMDQPPSKFPRETEEAQTRFAAWLAEYDRQAVQYKVCEKIEQFGSAKPSLLEQQIIDLHDGYVLEEGAKPLA